MRGNYWKSISDHAIKETWNKTPGHSGIWECYLGEKAPQILPQIRAYQNSVPDLRNPNIHIKNTISSYSCIGTWVALGLGSHLLLKHAIHKNNSNVPSPQRYQKSQQMRAVVIQTVTFLHTQLWKSGPKHYFFLAFFFTLQTNCRGVVRGAESSSGHCGAKAGGAPWHWK